MKSRRGGDPKRSEPWEIAAERAVRAAEICHGWHADRNPRHGLGALSNFVRFLRTRVERVRGCGSSGTGGARVNVFPGRVGRGDLTYENYGSKIFITRSSDTLTIPRPRRPRGRLSPCGGSFP